MSYIASRIGKYMNLTKFCHKNVNYNKKNINWRQINKYKKNWCSSTNLNSVITSLTNFSLQTTRQHIFCAWAILYSFLKFILQLWYHFKRKMDEIKVLKNQSHSNTTNLLNLIIISVHVKDEVFTLSRIIEYS